MKADGCSICWNPEPGPLGQSTSRWISSANPVLKRVQSLHPTTGEVVSVAGHHREIVQHRDGGDLLVGGVAANSLPTRYRCMQLSLSPPVRTTSRVPLAGMIHEKTLRRWVQPQRSWYCKPATGDQLASAISSFSRSSPLLYISIRMSEPPMNSPFTYTCGIVGHSENSLIP